RGSRCYCARTRGGWCGGCGALSFAKGARGTSTGEGTRTRLPRAKGVKNADYEAKRRELLDRMLPRFARLDLERPSLRQLAAAAEVTAPTLQHYFGDRTGVVAAL